MKDLQNIIIGWDNGNGTSIASAEIRKKVFECFFPSVFGIGRKGQRFNSAEQTKFIDPKLNGNAIDFGTIVDSIQVWGGQTAYTVRQQPVDLHGITRYYDKKFMSYMYHLTLQGLINDGMPLASENRLHMTVGMPPEIFYETPDEAEKIKDAFIYLLQPGEDYISAKSCFNDKPVEFIVDRLTFTSEGAGAYYDTIINKDLSPSSDAVSYTNDGVLIIDIGRYTFDAFILLDNQIGEEKVYTSKDHGLESFFGIINEELEGTSVPVNEIERQNYSKSSRIGRLREDSYGDVYSRAMDRYIDSLSTPLSHFKERSDTYKNVLITGGIVDLFDDKRMVRDIFAIEDYPVTPLSTRSNGRGYRKFAKIVRLHEK